MREDGGPGHQQPLSLAKVGEELWDPDEADRLVKLAFRYPELLTHEEQVLWKLIRENGSLWRGGFDGPDGEWQWKAIEANLRLDQLRVYWNTLKRVVSGEISRDELPKWPETRAKASRKL